MKTSYTNPHAVTDIGGTTGYVYDNTGNMTVAGGWLYTPDYRNRLTIAVLDEEITHTYAYDDQNQRVKKVKHDGFTTYYPNKYYNITPIPSPVHNNMKGDIIAVITKRYAESSYYSKGHGRKGAI